ncbi:MAG: hypothetical protein ACYDCK_03950 [Thermoplasmatota archaeon]
MAPSAWFTRKSSIGFGFVAATWQGWVATLAVVVLIAADIAAGPRGLLRVVIAVVIIGVFFALAWVKGAGPDGWHGTGEPRGGGSKP